MLKDMLRQSCGVSRPSLAGLMLLLAISNPLIASEITVVRDKVVRGEEMFDYVALNEFFVANEGQELFKLRNRQTIVKQALVPEVVDDNVGDVREAKKLPAKIFASGNLNGRPTLFACASRCSEGDDAIYVAFQGRGPGKYQALSSLYVSSGGTMRPRGPVTRGYEGVFVLVELEDTVSNEAYDSYMLADLSAGSSGSEVATIRQTRFSKSGTVLFTKDHSVESGSWLNVGARARMRYMIQGGLPLFLVTGVSNASY